MLDYTIPTFAGFMMVVMIVRWIKPGATYCAVSLLSIFVTPNYEATLLFILFMGYYPILKYYLDQKRKPPVGVGNKACSVQCGDSHILFGFSVYLYFAECWRAWRCLASMPCLSVAAANLFFFIYDYASHS